jgi:hypothetical protein
MATTMLESIPPERKAPRGTSERSLKRTASSINPASCLTAVDSSRELFGANVMSQYFEIVRVSFSYIAKCPGGSLDMPSKIVRGEGT